MSAAEPLIAVENLTKVYGLLPVLKSLDFCVARGERVAVLGGNGSGKSTLLRLLGGLCKPSGGRMRIGGWEIPGEAAAVRAQIGMVSHKPLLYASLTARENLDFFGRLYQIAPVERAARIDALLRQVGLHRRADSRVQTFSRGMQQRLSIARAVLHQPAVLLFDEPYTGLDQEGAALLDALLCAEQPAPRTLIITTHQLQRLPGLADRAIVLAGGRIAGDQAIAQTSLQNLSEWVAEASR